MGRCPAIKPNGQRCKGEAAPGAEWCYSHDPARAEQRRSNAARGGKIGGRGRPQTETNDIKKEIRGVIGGVLSGQIPQGQGAVALQGYNSLLRAQEQERREEAGHISPEELQLLIEQIVAIVGRHLPPERLRGFVEEIGQFIDEASSG
ncbi:MAG: hypothetical protein M3R38_16170 [Actinomycetota bacterium]|nr:hypothetical protein [Actinomycetota bacterium]